MSCFDFPEPTIAARSAELFRQQQEQVHRRTDRAFGLLMVIQYLAGIALACLLTPFTWHGSLRAIHIHVYSAVFLGAILAAMPLYLISKHPGSALTRHVIAISQLVFSGLLVHLTGGRIETHFHVFGSLAFLAYYRDWRVLVTATIVTAGDHFIRGTWWPLSIYGVGAAPLWRTFEHAGWVLFAEVFFVYASFQNLRDMQAVASQRAQLEFTKSDVEAQVIRRTCELDEMRIAAEAASQSKSDFLANTSHELRTPLTAIIGFSETLIESKQPAETLNDAATTIHRNSEHLLSLINDILDLSKVESGHFQIHKEQCDLGTLLADVASIAQSRAATKKLDFGIEFTTPIPRTIFTDTMRLRQILINLLGNAVKFTQEGGVRLAIRLLEDNPPTLQFDVIDTGIGISELDQAQLFQAFSQADSTTSRRFGGTGLGLAISRSLAHLLGGDVVIADSVEGIGTRFRFNLNISSLPDVEMMKEPLLALAEARSSSAEKQTDSKLPYRILLAEDGADNQRLILHILRKANARAVLAQNGQEAVDVALTSLTRGSPFDAILMDMQMPVLDGYEATRALRRASYTGPIIALTANAMTGDREKCMKAGCDDFLTKPINRSKFIATIRRCVESKQNAASHVSSPFQSISMEAEIAAGSP
ncbi:MAG: ATP-binding protein [Planctomycetota bacterium]